MTPHPPLRRARWALMIERLTPAGAPAAALLALGLIAALLDLPQRAPVLVHLTALILWSVGLIVALALGLRRVRRPSEAEARARIDAASHLAHRPIASLADRPAAPDAVTAALWRAHQDRLCAGLPALRFGWPRSPLLRLDPYALRATLALGLVVAGAVAGPEAPQRLAAAVAPSLDALAGPPPSLDLWLTPPAYVGAPPLLLSRRPQTEPTAAPAGSTLTAMVNDATAPPHVRFGADGPKIPFTPAGERAWRLEGVPVQAGDAAVQVGGRTLGRWPLTVTPDLPPVARLTQPPSLTRRQALRLDYAAEDDYGVTELALRLSRGTQTLTPPPLPIALNRPSATGRAIVDLTDHPWAGLTVELRLVARDALGQEGVSDPVALPLPERQFRHPVARQVIAARRRLTAEPEAPTPVIAALAQILSRPDLFGDDVGAFLALSAARARLSLRPGDAEAVDEVQALLWAVALRIEEGALGEQERALRAAEAALRDALARNAPDAEIDRLMAEMQAALDRYLAALAQSPETRPNAQRRADGERRTITRDQLMRQLEKARELARQGQRDAAQALLDQWRSVMEQLNAASAADADADADADAADAANPDRQALQNLQSLARRQQDLMDRSLRAEMNRRAGPDAGLAQDQRALREALGDAVRRLGESGAEIPGGLGKAEQAMRRAQDQLDRNQPGRAGAAMNDALAGMRDAARALAQRMTGSGASQAGPSDGAGRGASGSPGEGPEDGVDPFGRQAARPQGAEGSGVRIPDDNQVRRARDILDELRRRAADPDRPGLELDYLDRLLKRF